MKRVGFFRGLKRFIIFRLFRSMDREDQVIVVGRLLGRAGRFTPAENIRMSLMIAEQEGRNRRRGVDQ